MAEFQAVILAGGEGASLFPLTEHTPKALLPVVHKPLLAYQLEMLEQSNFSDVIVITTRKQEEDVRNMLQTSFKDRLIVDLHVMDDDDSGTAEALLAVKDKIRTDFVVIASDLITDVPLYRVADVHRLNDATVTAVIQKTPSAETNKKARDEHALLDYVGFSDNGRLLYLTSEASIQGDFISIHRRMMQEQTQIRLSKQYTDAHLYFMAKWVLEVIEERNFTSIKGELLPYLVRQQFKQVQTSAVPDIHEDTKLIEQMSNSEPVVGKIRCFTFINEGVCLRAKTLSSYMRMNLDRALLPGPFAPPKLDNTAIKEYRKAVAKDSVVADGIKLGDNTSIKKSVIGKHCKVGSRTRIVNSVIMDHVSIGDNCTIQNSIICSNSELAEKVELVSCQVGTKYVVAAGGKHKNEQLASNLLSL